MKIQPKAFIAIERSIATAMHAEWDRLSGSIMKELHSAVERRDWAAAETLGNKLTMKAVVTSVRPRLEELALSAILFGAHRVTGNVKTTHFAKNKVIPKELRAALDQMEHAVEHDGSDYVRKDLHAKIAELKHQDERAHVQKDDMSEATLATGGLLEPERAQAPLSKKKKRKLRKSLKTLYVHRDLTNPEPFLAWAKAQGFMTTLPVEDLHVTICYSKSPISWNTVHRDTAPVIVSGGSRGVDQFGKGAVVLTFECEILEWRNQMLRRLGATSDFPDYHPHVTITYDVPEGMDLSAVTPYDGELIFGPEVFEEIKGDGFDPDDLEEEALKAEFDLAAALNGAVDKGGKVAMDLGANLTTSRLVTFGFLSQAMEGGHKTYQVDEVLDERTCPVCEAMNGATFDVEKQYARTLQALGTSDPQDLTEIAPWPDLGDVDGGDPDEMQANGYGAPPYHPGCRGMLSLVEEEEPASVGLGGDLLAGAGEIEDRADADEFDDGTGATEAGWDDAAVQQLGWDRFEVTDPEVFSDVDAAFEEGDYDQAQALIDHWKQKHPVEKEDEFEGPNQPKKKRRNQAPAGRDQDYDDIHSDSSSVAFDSGVSNDANAPLET